MPPQTAYNSQVGAPLLAIVAGYEDGNDCNTLRHDPIFKIALGRLPERGEDLCSQSTVSVVLNNTPGIRISKDTRDRVLKTATQLGYEIVQTKFNETEARRRA